jgi:hypothetical protein
MAIDLIAINRHYLHAAADTAECGHMRSIHHHVISSLRQAFGAHSTKRKRSTKSQDKVL